MQMVFLIDDYKCSLTVYTVGAIVCPVVLECNTYTPQHHRAVH